MRRCSAISMHSYAPQRTTSGMASKCLRIAIGSSGAETQSRQGPPVFTYRLRFCCVASPKSPAHIVRR